MCVAVGVLPRASVAHADTSAAGDYVPLTSVEKLLDTRDATGVSTTTKTAAGASTTFQVLGQGSIPSSGVSAVAVTLQVISPEAYGYLTINPSDATTTASSLTYYSGENTSGYDIVRLTSTGKFTITNHSDDAVHIVVSARGYFLTASSSETGSGYHPLDTALVYDTRKGIGTGSPTAPVAASGTATFDLAGVSGIPSSGVTAVALNIVAVNQTTDGYLTLRPSDGSSPGPTAVYFVTGEQDSNFQIVRLSDTGKVSVTNKSSGTLDISVSIRGYYANDDSASGGAVFTPTAPTALVDTVAGSESAIAAGGSYTFTATSQAGVPANTVAAVALEINARRTNADGYLSAYPADTADPKISTVTFDDAESSVGFDQTIPSVNGRITITNHSSGAIHLQVILHGYYIYTTVPVLQGDLDTDADTDAMPEADAQALDAAEDRADDDSNLAPPYYNPATGDLVAPALNSTGRATAAADLAVSVYDNGTGAYTDSALSALADTSTETAGSDETATQGADESDTVMSALLATSVTPTTLTVPNNTTTLETIRDEVIGLDSTTLPNADAIYDAYVQPEHNRVVVEATSVTSDMQSTPRPRQVCDLI
jgi:hypothetical protein